MAKTSKQEPGTLDADVHIVYEDQQKINKFARSNARLEDVKEEIKARENSLQNLRDAEDEMIIALDDDEKVPFMIGEVFIMKSQDEAQECIAAQRTTLEKEKEELSAKATALQEIMTGLKADLYAKFGTNINLEAEED